MKSRRQDLAPLVDELRTTLGKLELALGAVSDSIVWTSLDGTVQWCNSTFDRLIGRAHISLLGTDLTSVLPLKRQGLEVPPSSHPFALALRGRRTDPAIYEFQNGARLALLEISWQAASVSADSPVIVFLIRDVTERVRAEGARIQALQATEAANKELEAFSYSVAHDLRAPLRHIDGFSRMLSERYPEKLGDQGKNLLERICQASAKMGQLIEDLLNLSRVGRVSMQREEVDLSRLARDIAQSLQSSEPRRRAAFLIQDRLTARGDSRLLNILLENLLSNAWKFSSKIPESRIEFGSRQEGGAAVYFVRDNGAGFDMAYSGKLFGIFERLHQEGEFPGTGIGLATVHRIVERHRGRIWAEAEIGRGAVFYFTLQARPSQAGSDGGD